MGETRISGGGGVLAHRQVLLDGEVGEQLHEEANRRRGRHGNKRVDRAASVCQNGGQWCPIAV